VPGDICEPALKPVARFGLAGRGVAPEIPNGLADVWPGPLGFAGGESDEVSDWTALNAVDAAPRAIMIKLPHTAKRGPHFSIDSSATTCRDKARATTKQATCHDKKPGKIHNFGVLEGSGARQLMPLRQNLPPSILKRLQSLFPIAPF
jgi:hypothetical protein